MRERENVLTISEQLINDSQEIIDNSETHEIIRKVADLINKRAVEINNICTVEKYDLFFNGAAGKGKTSAISSLFNLVDRSAKSKHEFPLLRTAPGRTTPCETIVIQNDDVINKITIIKLDDDEFNKILADYCYRFYDKEIPLDEESTRIIDNMLGLRISDSNEEKFNNLKERSEFNVDSKDILLEYAMNFIAYDKRTTTEIELTLDKLKEQFRKTLSDIGNGKREDCPYPKQIIINISKNAWDLNIPSCINKIIDTRGIDSPERKDIQDAIKDRANIVIMCDEVPLFAGDGNTLSILKNVLIKENRDDSFRTFYVGLEKGKQLNVLSESNDRIEGMKIKKNESINKFETNNISFKKDNILFFNAFKGVKISDDSDIIGLDEDEYNAERLCFLEDIQKCLNRMYISYNDEVLDMGKNINLLKQNKITDKTFDNFAKIQLTVDEMKNKVKCEYDIIKNIVDDIGTRHAGRVRAMVNRQGDYDTCNIYEISEKLGGLEFASTVLSLKDTLIGNINGVFDDMDEIGCVCMKTLISKVEDEYLSAYRKNQNYYYDYVSKIMNVPKPWVNPKSYWGDESGNYRYRVVNDVERYLREHLVSQSRVWEDFFNNISNFTVIE